jgi:alkylation response protein AidB-like acyl-CoA dehydrogenase
LFAGNTPGSYGHVRLFDSRGQRQRRLDARVRDLVLAIDALGVDPEEDIHAVPGPLGDLGRRDPGIQPSRNGCVAQVVRVLGQRRGELGIGTVSAYGITLEYSVLRHASNLESVLTYEGTSEMHTLVIGQALTRLSAFS